MNEKDRKGKIGQLLRLLKSQTTLVLASVGTDGLPHSTPLFFLADDQMRLYWYSARTSRHSRNCARNPRAAVAVFRPARRWQQIAGAQMEGWVTVVRDRAGRARIRREFCERFALDEQMANTIRRSSLYCFTAEWIRLIRNTQKFGEKFEVRLPRPQIPSLRTSSL